MSVAFAETESSGDLTANRQEKKYLLDRAAVGAFLPVMERHLPRHRFEGDGASLLPDAEHYVTTTYFDTASHAQLRAALREPEGCVKLRAREYYDQQIVRMKGEDVPRTVIVSQPWVWCEMKQRLGERTQKHRFRLGKVAVPAFFRGEHVAFRAHALGPELRAVVDFVQSAREPLVPSCVVNYQRIAFQNRCGTLRLTLDLDVGFYAGAPEVWSRGEALVQGTFGAPLAVERSALVEVKSTGRPPEWLNTVLEALRATPTSYSKFARAGSAAHGIPSERDRALTAPRR